MKRIFIFIAVCICTINAASQTCTRFMGGNKTVMPCSDPFTLDFSQLFVSNDPLLFGATFQPTILTPTDTLPGNGVPDTVIYYMAKTKVVATATNGCKDSAIVRVLFRGHPLPNLGPDITVFTCPGKKIDISGLVNTGFLTPQWSTPTPRAVDSGIYTVSVTSLDGCTDMVQVTVKNFPKPSLGPDTTIALNGSTFNLNTLYPTTGLSRSWNTANTNAAPAGFYRLIVTNTDGCPDTAFATLCAKPNLGADKTVNVCPGGFINLYEAFDFTGLESVWNTATPTFAITGNYQVIVTNLCGRKDTANVQVVPAAKPNIGIDLEESICENETLNLLNYYSPGTLTQEWNIPDPEAAPVGTHRLIVTNNAGCKDTAFFTVNGFPKQSFIKDTLVKICGSQKKDLTQIFPFDENYIVDYGTGNPTAADTGTYTVNIQDQIGCSYTIKIKVENAAVETGPLNLCVYNTSNAAAFSTNAFRTILADKQGNIWAGADAGGMYKFTVTGNACGNGSWVKSGFFGNNTYRDLQPSIIIGDNSIWAASAGNQLPYNITGGVDKFINTAAAPTHFGSVFDATNGGLRSRNANSIAMGTNGRVYVALGQSLQVGQNGEQDTVMQGGIYEYNLITAPTQFNSIMINMPTTDIRCSAAGTRGDELWFGVQRSCDNGNCSNPYIVKWDASINGPGGFVNENNSPIPFTDQNLIVRAIFTDATGRTFVGFNTGFGFAVIESDAGGVTPVWSYLTSNNSGFPNNAAVNFNAITEVNGEIWIGTTAGLLIYDGVGDLTDCSSYRLYTTANNLPSNNVTDITYDTTRLQVWFTTDAGICKISADTTVSGNIYNVYCGKNDALLTKIKKAALQNATVTLRRLDNSVVKQQTTGADGTFELSGGKPGQEYILEVKYANKFSYKYTGVKFNSLIGDVLIPDSLIKELTTFKEVLKERTLALKLPAESITNLLSDSNFIKRYFSSVTADGFDISKFDTAFGAFKAVISDNHLKRVENLADYYVSLATIYNLGVNADSLVGIGAEAATDVVFAIIDIVKFFGDLKELADKVKKAQDPANLLENNPFTRSLDTLFKKTAISVVRSLVAKGQEMLLDYLKKRLDSAKDNVNSEEDKKTYDLISSVISGLLDQIALMVSGDSGIANFSKDDILKTMAGFALNALGKKLTALYYERYCRVRHKNLIDQLSQQVKDHVSSVKYPDAYLRNYNPLEPGPGEPLSLNKYGIDILDETILKVSTLKDVSGGLDVAASVTNTLASLALSSVWLAEAAPILKGISGLMQGLKLSVLGGAVVGTLLNARTVANLSDNVVGYSGYQPILARGKAQSQAHIPLSISSLRNAKTLYHQKLREYQILIRKGFDTAAYISNFRDVLKYDSAYDAEIVSALNGMWPYFNNANAVVPGFEQTVQLTTDTYLEKQRSYRSAFFMQNASYMWIDSTNSTQVPYLDSLVNTIIISNDNTADAVEYIMSLINTNNIQAPAFLKKESVKINFNYQPGSNGSITYTFKNYGGVTQNNVSFKISPLTGGFVLNSADSVNVGNIAPGATKQVTYQFTAPQKDTVGNYSIDIKADNGYVQDLSDAIVTFRNTGEAISIKAGNWNDPATWNTGAVPTQVTAVTVLHDVKVNINASCKSVKVQTPGKITVNTGFSLKVFQ